MVMPSRFEGLPVTMVEAQMASLPCVVSGNITDEAQFTTHVQYINGWELETWVDAIKKYFDIKRQSNRTEMLSSPFNIEIAAQELMEILIGEKTK